MAAADLAPEGVVRWGERVASEASRGIYLVALTDNADSATEGALREPPISVDALEGWLEVRPELRLDGKRPTVPELADRLAAFWLADEVVVYVGLTTRPLRTRVAEYYKTLLGAKRPHSGGYFLKTLGDLSRFYVHFAYASDPGAAEGAMLRAFCGAVTDKTRAALHDPEHPFPFANLEWPPGRRKRHGIRGARGEMPPR